MSVLVVQETWELLERDSLLPEGGRPKHLLWVLHFMKVYPPAEPGVFGRWRVCRRRRPEDPPQVGLGIYRRRRQPGRRCGEFNTHCGDQCGSDKVLKYLGHSDA